MCGRYTLIRGNAIVDIVQNVTIPSNLRLLARYNIAPTQEVPVIASDSNQLQLFRWGLVPAWSKDDKSGFKMINARAETLAEKPAFRSALAQRRCLVPADGFYEWRKNPAGSSTPKTPMFIHLHNHALFAFAGLWESWRNPDGTQLRTFTIITTAANDLMKSFHDRMPVILTADACSAWLVRGTSDLLRPFPADTLRAIPVSPLVNSPRNEGESLITPAEPAQPAPAPTQGSLFE